jgi:class 3 adenylate cyclase
MVLGGAMVEQLSGTVTLVFTEIEGSTRLLTELGEESYGEALADHRRVVRARKTNTGAMGSNPRPPA